MGLIVSESYWINNVSPGEEIVLGRIDNLRIEGKGRFSVVCGIERTLEERVVVE